MLKKLILASTTMALTAGVAFANPAPYIGAGLGINTNTSSTGNYRSMPFNVLAGYGGLIDQSFYLAGELNATLGAAEISDVGIMKTTYSYGVSILPGVMLSDKTLAFARIGLVNTRFTDQDARTKPGAQFGIGLQTAVTQNVDLRGEYDYTAYRSFNQSTYARATNPRTDAFNLSLVYKID